MAYVNLGTAYYDGKGVKKDYQKAIEYYKKAADLGDVVAYVNLGKIYYEGKGVKQDYQKALQYYKKAADLGDETGRERYKSLLRELGK